MKRFISSLLLTLCAATTSTNASAETVWHCSRTPNSVFEDSVVSDQFGIASNGVNKDVIQVSLQDIYDIFSGTPVRISGVSLSACFVSDDSKLSQDAIRSLGLESTTLQRLIKRANIVQSRVYAVQNETNIPSCIAKHYPAIGYMSHPQKTAEIAPCF